ncbi:MAG: PfkB family carbohydrate kinase [Desulfuromonadales bacterium]|nr:PfkB family carbohydrate kinase [Desulfuromonadales bacterium]
MSILVVGSVAIDSVQTPFGIGNNVLGGSATYFSTAASFFTNVNLVAVVGEDFPEEHLEFLKSRNIDLKGLSIGKGKTFQWKGRYGFDLNEAETIKTDLNVFQSFRPVIPAEYVDSEYIILANIDPDLQLEVLDQVKNPKIVACDTMNYWISSKLDVVKKVISKVDFLIINEGEARQLAGEVNLVKAAAAILNIGAKSLIVKRGEYGVLYFSSSGIFATPAYLLENVFDPTGAGDTFAGGFMGYLANTGNLSDHSIRQAVVFGSVMASFNVEDFSLNRLKTLEYHEIEERYQKFKAMTHFDEL